MARWARAGGMVSVVLVTALGAAGCEQVLGLDRYYDALCAPGATRACYGGPMGTEGVGICKAGTQTCHEDGQAWSDCVGEVRPEPVEDCSRAGDENCDGVSCSDAIWAERFAGAKGHGQGIAADKDGNVVVTGYIDGPVDFGGGPLMASGNTGFVAKLDPKGKHLWSTTLGDMGPSYGNGVAVDGAGNIVVAGAIPGMNVIKFDPKGKVLWSQPVGSTADASNTARAAGVAVDGAGNILVFGNFVGTVDLGSGPVTSNGGYGGIFVVALDSAGHHLWDKEFGDMNSQLDPKGIALDKTGNIIIVGGASGPVDFGGGSLPYTPNTGESFVVKLDPKGDHVWSKLYGKAGSCFANAVAVDASDNIVVAGAFTGSFDVGAIQYDSVGTNDFFVLKLAPAGTHLWSNTFGHAQNHDQGINSMTVDRVGDVVLTGIYNGTLDFGGGPLTNQNAGFVVKLGPAGKFLWSKILGLAAGEASAADGTGRLLLSGVIGGEVDLGTGPLMPTGDENIFVAAFNP